MKLSQMVW